MAKIKVNEVYGIYTVKEILNEKASDGHKLYLIKCNICGKEFKRSANGFASPSGITTKCQHLSKEELEQKAINDWLNGEHYCRSCGKLMTEKFGSGIYCSYSCSNKRELTQESRDKISKSIKGNKAYKNINTGKIKYFKEGEEIPDDYVKTCSKRKLNSKHKKHRSKINSRLANKKLIELNKDYIYNHNNEVIAKYEELLKEKSIGKEFYLENQFVFAKYLSVTDCNHPRGHEGHVFVHILLAEKLLDRYLTNEEIVHHKNHNKLDNRFDNIYIFNNLASHARFHGTDMYWLTINNDVLICDKLDMTKLKEHFNKVHSQE